MAVAPIVDTFQISSLGGGFKYFLVRAPLFQPIGAERESAKYFLVSSLPGEMIQFDQYF